MPHMQELRRPKLQQRKLLRGWSGAEVRYLQVLDVLCLEENLDVCAAESSGRLECYFRRRHSNTSLEALYGQTNFDQFAIEAYSVLACIRLAVEIRFLKGERLTLFKFYENDRSIL